MATLQESLVLGHCFICTLIGLPIIVFASFLQHALKYYDLFQRPTFPLAVLVEPCTFLQRQHFSSFVVLFFKSCNFYSFKL